MTERIDRTALVRRHNVQLTQPDARNPLTLGNGDFGYTADITGMQTFRDFHDPEVATAQGRVAVNTCTMSTWGWHSMPNPKGYTAADAMTTYETSRGPVPYADRFDFRSVMSGNATEADLAGLWLNNNPQRLDLGRLGLELRSAPDEEPESDPAALHDIEQTLDMWTGLLTSKFTYSGVPVTVETVAAPDSARVAFKIQSELLKDSRLTVAASFAYAAAGFFQPNDWGSPDLHSTTLQDHSEHNALLRRVLDDTTYSVALAWSSGKLSTVTQHHLRISAQGTDTLEIVAEFGPSQEIDRPASGFTATTEEAAAWWERFWLDGAAVEFEGSTDPRAAELERRVVLSQYLTAVNCSGSTPPQETGLVTNSWQGKFHLEMHFWHAAHFVSWGRPQLLERSLGWYSDILGVARENAERQHYEGARWPKQVGPEGRDSPNDIGPFLIWQQPHILYFAELLYRAKPSAELLTAYAEIVDATAKFMGSFVEERNGTFHLPAPLIPAQEFYDRHSVEDPTFELAYWWWGLEIANRWRERQGLERDPHWTRVQENLARPHQHGGIYSAIATEPYLKRDDHPSLIAVLGVVPRTPLVQDDIVLKTIRSVVDDWEWDSAWGWDFPVLAMAATRAGDPQGAIDAIMMGATKNVFSENGHNAQAQNYLPIYLPGNGSLLAAVSLMVAGWDGSEPLPGFPDSGWSVRHEGFLAWP